MAAAAATSGAQSSSSSSSSGSSNQGQEFIVRIPKQTKKRYHVMRFNAAHKQDISKWSQIRMERENNMKEFKMEDEMPKFGAGSEFGRDQKEEARRKKYGIIMKKYNPDDQPWLLRVGGKGGKKFKAIREGGVSENTSFYVFCKAPDGVFEAFPIEEWYNFNPVNRFKALTAEEAEVEFERRDKVMNHFSIMVRKKMALEEEGAKEEGEEEKGKKGKKGKKEKNRDFQITEMDDWVSDSDGDGDDDSDGDRDDDGDGGKKKKKGKAGEDDKKKKKKKNQSDEEALEESDEGDFDDREVDYMSASSSEEEEPEDEKANRELKGVEDEDALRAVDQSDEEEEGEKEEEKPENEEEAAKDEKSAEPKPKSKADKKEGGSSKSASKGNSSGESSSESSDSDFDDSKFQSAMFMQSSARQKPKKKNGCESANSSRANTPTKHVSDEKKSKGSSKSLKRKMMEESPSAAKTDGSAPKRPRSESNLPSTPSMPSSWSSSTEGITEESVRRYLLRKPMTTTELLQKFKSKRTGLSSEKLVNTIAQILKRLNPEKQTIKGKLYLSIKP
ncbi:general transcription factor IIF subunit 1 isoform X5 [Rhipicephalus sanguineus]|uniref:general transcription factor IIF subunit 1 isoform X5 n=1 Tax=Rhipicephalus sanguineus TaxID=34632 RepID=UPI0018949CC4|nr:general transcription factor IIF subunit 1 isoform X5 [Rhipicephalus sanguineus]